MFGFFKKKQLAREPDLEFAAKGYLQIATIRRYRPELDLSALERGYAEQLLDSGCSLNQAYSARWGGAYAIQDDLQNFDDALLSMREARRASGMNDKMETPAEAEAMYLVSAKAVIALVHILDPTEYEHFLAYIGVEK